MKNHPRMGNGAAVPSGCIQRWRPTTMGFGDRTSGSFKFERRRSTKSVTCEKPSAICSCRTISFDSKRNLRGVPWRTDTGSATVVTVCFASSICLLALVDYASPLNGQTAAAYFRPSGTDLLNRRMERTLANVLTAISAAFKRTRFRNSTSSVLDFPANPSPLQAFQRSAVLVGRTGSNVKSREICSLK